MKHQRVGMFIEDGLRESALLASDMGVEEIADQARADGVRDLRQSGLVKVRLGVTTLEEVLAATNE